MRELFADSMKTSALVLLLSVLNSFWASPWFYPSCEHQTRSLIISSTQNCVLCDTRVPLFLCVCVWERGESVNQRIWITAHLSEKASSHRWRAAAGVRAQGLPCLMLLLSGDQLLFIFPSPPGARQQTRDGGRGERNIRGIEGSVGQKGGGGTRWNWRICIYRSTEQWVCLLESFILLSLQ